MVQLRNFLTTDIKDRGITKTVQHLKDDPNIIFIKTDKSNKMGTLGIAPKLFGRL